MATSKEAILFGVLSYSQRHHINPDHWARMRCGFATKDAAYGSLLTDDGPVMWFRDVTRRDEFQTEFGGMKVTLSRKVEVLYGDRATNTLRKMEKSRNDR